MRHSRARHIKAVAIGLLFLWAIYGTPALAQTPIACGETLPGSIGSGEEDAFTFTGTANEAVLFAAVATSGTLVARAELYGPVGQFLGSNANNLNSPSLVLPSTGSYTIRVRDSAGTGTGYYNLNLQFTTGRCGSPIACGQTTGGSINGNAEQDTYAFTGTANEAVLFAAVATTGTLVARAELYGPAGQFIGSTANNFNSPTLVLPATGTYTILVRDSVLNKEGDYNVNLQFTTGRCGTPIACGQTTGGSIDGNAEQDTYAFTGTANEAVLFAAVATTGTLVARAELYGPAGQFIGSTANNFNSPTLVLPATGTYTILVRDSVLNKEGAYNVNLQFTTGRCGTPIACGQTTGGSIDGNAEQDTYAFTGTANEAVLFAAVATSGTLVARAELYGPAGQFLGSTANNLNSPTLVLPSTGTYTILVRDSVLNREGAYNLNLQFTTGRCGTPIACGQTLEGTITGNAQQDAYTFAGDQNQKVIVAAAATSGTLQARAEVYGPAGQFLGSSVTNSSTPELVLPSTGTYTVLVRDGSLNKEGAYHVHLLFTTGHCGPADFYTLTPCRVVDTRGPSGPGGGPALAAGLTRTFETVGRCGIPLGARALSVNIAITAPTATGHLRVFPRGGGVPDAAAINYTIGQTRANNAILPLGLDAAISVRCLQGSGTVHFILDVNGYFE